MSLLIEQPGLLATLQDRGRFNQLGQGITQGGPIDERAYLWANRLLDNDNDCAQIEVTMGGFRARCQSDLQLAFCGGLELVVNGQKQPSWQSFWAPAGSVLEINAAAGLRGYLAVAGGFVGKPVYGSVATVVRDHLGGLQGDGKPLQRGDHVPVRAAAKVPQRRRRPVQTAIPKAPQPLFIPIVAAAQYAEFGDACHAQLTQQVYQVSAAQDRMGMRLQGTKPLASHVAQLISEPLPIGAVQVPADGQPIVMLNDRQTLGGYPKIATVTWLGRCWLAQLPAGSTFQFTWQDLATARQHYLRILRFFNLAR